MGQLRELLSFDGLVLGWPGRFGRRHRVSFDEENMRKIPVPKQSMRQRGGLKWSKPADCTLYSWMVASWARGTVGFRFIRLA